MLTYNALKIINLFLKALHFEKSFYSVDLQKDLEKFKTEISALNEPTNQRIAKGILDLTRSHKSLKQAMLNIKENDPAPSSNFGLVFGVAIENVKIISNLITEYLEGNCTFS